MQHFYTVLLYSYQLLFFTIDTYQNDIHITEVCSFSPELTYSWVSSMLAHFMINVFVDVYLFFATTKYFD